jgi:lipopolysaccharide biosynthesis glycosyltransferase
MKNLIAFTIDENYLEPFMVAIQSFIAHHDVNQYEIALVHSNISKKNIQKIKTYMQSYNIYFKEVYIEDEFKTIKVGYHFNSVIFYRLLLPKIFREYKKILYIDSDILFLKNIDELFKIDLNENILAAIPKHEHFLIPTYLQHKTKDYFASGLLLINTQKFIDNKIYEKCLKFLKNEKYEMPDQDALNATVNQWIQLDLEYGVETAFLEKNDNELSQRIQNPRIIQFSGSSKPWHFRNNHPYKNLYWKYLKMTPFKRYIPEDLTVFNVFKWMIPKKIKEFMSSIKKSVNNVIKKNRPTESSRTKR